MAVVFIPTLLRDLAGRESITVPGSNVRQLIEEMERECPGIRARLVDQGRLRTGVSVAVDGEVSPAGLLAEVTETSEVHFVLAISGGS